MHTGRTQQAKTRLMQCCPCPRAGQTTAAVAACAAVLTRLVAVLLASSWSCKRSNLKVTSCATPPSSSAVAALNAAVDGNAVTASCGAAESCPATVSHIFEGDGFDMPTILLFKCRVLGPAGSNESHVPHLVFLNLPYVPVEECRFCSKQPPWRGSCSSLRRCRCAGV